MQAPYFPRAGGRRSRSCSEHYSKGQLRAQGTRSKPKCSLVQPVGVAVGVAGWPKGTHMAPLRELGAVCGSSIATLLGGEYFPLFMSQQLSYKVTACWVLGWHQPRDASRCSLAPSSWRGLSRIHSGSHCMAGPWTEGTKPSRPVVLSGVLP